MLTARVPGAGPAPALDFRREMVILVAQGVQRSGGHSVRIESIALVRGALVVNITRHRPAPGCVTMTALTSPADAVVVGRWGGPVRYLEAEVTDQCVR